MENISKNFGGAGAPGAHPVLTPMSKYNTGGKVNGSLLIIKHESKSGVNSITNRLSLLWNALPAKLKSCSSSHQFRGEFIEILQSDEKLVIHLFSLMFGNVVSV